MDDQGLLLRLREDGLLEPATPRAQQFLRQHGGVFRLVPGAEVMLLRRVDPGDEGAAVLLAGELRRAGALADSLSAIVRAGWSGELVVSEGTTRRTLFIGDARIVGAATTALSERIGAVMTRMGILDHDQLRTVVSRLAPGKRFGEVAIEEGFLTRERLFEVVRQQAEDIVLGAMRIADGSFAFLDGFDAAKVPARIHLDAREVVNAAMSRLAEASGVSIETRALEEPIARFNKAIQVIFRAVAMEGRAGALRAALDAFAAESPIDRAVFAVGRVAPDGRIDVAGVAEVLATLGVRDARETLTKRLHEYLVYALFVASGELPGDAERAVLEQVEGPMSALTPRVPPVRSMPPIALASAPVVPPLPAPAPAPVFAPAPAPAFAFAPAPAPAFAPAPAPAPAFAPAPAPAFAPGPGPAPAHPAVTAPIKRKRSSLAPIVLVAMVAAFGIAFALARRPVQEAASAPPPPRASAPPVAASQAVTPSPSPTPSASALPPSTVGTIRAADSGGHRVWIDGKLVGDSPQNYEVPCGHHVVRIGSSGQPQMVEVPCGGEVQVELR